MSKLMWMVCFGLCCWIGVSQAQYDISCRFKGVFHVEKGPRYNQTAEEARKTCAELDAVIATEEQMEIAMESGFEICRYGWIENNTLAIPRITPNKKCANNFVGLYVQHPNLTSMWDVFCYNASDQTERNCEKYDFKNESFVSRDPTLEEFPDAHDGHHSDDNAESVDPPIEDLATGDKSGSKQNRQKRMAAIPDWLIVCVSLVCLGLIFSVCIALNARRICGQKKKLVINGNNKGCPEDGVIMEQNGDTIKSQEMVQLVSKEQTNELGDQDEPLNQENMRNTKDVDMKIGV
ncbi:CD44 antigen isoform X2 [Rana temporaria]|uniref:CD44 antigen isoform X2 n=1 Tax=Rana temporaria TaxID=8407 RepID=UPI001AAC72CE|nr:CD44 antigen isoform X2 [Rana temporaria]